MNKTICSEIEWQRNYEKHMQRLNKASSIKVASPIKRKLSIFDYMRRQRQIEINRANLKLLEKFAYIAKNSVGYRAVTSPLGCAKGHSSLNYRVRSEVQKRVVKENLCIDKRLKSIKSVYSSEKYKHEYKKASTAYEEYLPQT
eukprot:TRINITY_DN17859_c0_g1_i2.p1 TRINITY_DN17859_c0_g1~~TRINITY_DN17859_c0_g1_i2.p1  ORF type:complete len:143 (+),score=28.16 TRINITY_DN17859_c0_g1_i2:128-556(+)